MQQNNDTHDNLCIRMLQAAVSPGWPRRIPAILLMLWVAVHFAPQRTVREILAAIILAGCIANLGRIGTHLRGGYLLLRPAKIRASEKPSVRQHLSALVIADVSLTLTGIAGAIVLMIQPEAPLLWHIGFGSLLCLAFYSVALATVERADELGLERGTEIVRKSRLGGWLFKIARKGTRFPPARWLLDLFDNPTPEDEPSTLALVIAAVLLFAPVATASVELGAAGEKQAISAFTKEDDDSGGSSATEEKSEQTPANESGSQPKAPPTEPIKDSTGYRVVENLHLIIGKTKTADPGTEIPLGPEDLPLVVAAVPLIARLYRLTPAGAKSESSVYILTRRDTTLFFKVTGK